VSERYIHPGIAAAASYWRGVIRGLAPDENVEKFGEFIANSLAGVFDSAEGMIEIHSKVPNLQVYKVFDKPNKPSVILRGAMKFAKLKLPLPPGIVMTISTTLVQVREPGAETKTLWRAPISYNKR